MEASAAAAMRWASANSPGSTAWCCCRDFPSTPRARAPSASSCGATCRARCCPTIRPRRRRPTGTRRAAGSAAAVVEDRTGTCRCDIGKPRCTCSTSHPTPPAFDGPEDRNGRRNHDEIRLWNDYLTPGAGGYMRDDAAAPAASRQGLPHHGRPEFRSGRRRQPARRHRRAARASTHRRHASCRRAPAPSRPPRCRAAPMPRSAATRASTPPTSTIASPGNLRVDYLLPSKGLRVCGGGVFWPPQCRSRPHLVWGEPAAELGSPPGVDRHQSQTQLDAHRAVIRQPVRLRILVIEHHAHEGLAFSTLRARSRPSRMLSMYSRYSLSVVQGVNFSRPVTLVSFAAGGHRVDLAVDIQQPALRRRAAGPSRA